MWLKKPSVQIIILPPQKKNLLMDSMQQKQQQQEICSQIYQAKMTLSFVFIVMALSFVFFFLSFLKLWWFPENWKFVIKTQRSDLMWVLLYVHSCTHFKWLAFKNELSRLVTWRFLQRFDCVGEQMFV